MIFQMNWFRLIWHSIYYPEFLSILVDIYYLVLYSYKIFRALTTANILSANSVQLNATETCFNYVLYIKFAAMKQLRSISLLAKWHCRSTWMPLDQRYDLLNDLFSEDIFCNQRKSMLSLVFGSKWSWLEWSNTLY